jgi:hypothetical protein
MKPSLLNDAIATAIRAFLLGILPDGYEVILAQDNRVPEPSMSDYAVMTPLWRDRFATNVVSAADVKFTGSISGTTLTVTQVAKGTISIGAYVFGPNVATGTSVKSAGTITGTYVVNTFQTVTSETMSAGQEANLQSTECVWQIDVHGNQSADSIQTISTLFRSAYGADWFDKNYPGIAPLYADQAKQLQFLNENQQYERRWEIDLHLQVSPSVYVPMQYADTLSANLENVL